MSYYVMRVCRKTALMLTVDLKSVNYDFSVDMTFYFRTIDDLHEMYQLLSKYRRLHQPIETHQIFTVYEYIRTHEKGV